LGASEIGSRFGTLDARTAPETPQSMEVVVHPWC
jgi:hypothetical protein